MSQDDRRFTLGRRDSDYEAAAMREKVVEHEAHFISMRPKIAALERDVETIIEMLRRGALLDISMVQAKLIELEAAMRDLLA